MLAQAVRRAQAQTQAQNETDLIRRITVTVHKSRTVRFDQPFEKAVVGAPDILDALPTNNQTLYVQGKKPGTTNVSIFDNTGRLVEVLVRRGEHRLLREAPCRTASAPAPVAGASSCPAATIRSC